MKYKICNNPTKCQLKQMMRQVSTKMSKHLASADVRQYVLLLLIASVNITECIFIQKSWLIGNSHRI